MTIAKADLPIDNGAAVVFSLDDGDDAHVDFNGSVYHGTTSSFHFGGYSAIEMVDKLNGWGAALVGWEA